MMKKTLAVISRPILLSILFVAVSFGAFAQFSGPDLCMAGINITYGRYGTTSQNWSISSNGTIISKSLSGPVSVVVIRWNSPGASTVSINADGTVYTLKVTVLSTPIAPSANYPSRCGPGTVTYSTSPGHGGTSIRWFAESTGGDFFAEGNNYTTTITGTKIIYAASYNSNLNIYSATRTACTASVKPLPPAPTVSMNSRIGPGTLTLQATGGSTYSWYNPSGTLLGTSPTFTTPVVSGSANNYMYAISYESSTGCTGVDKTWINVNIEPSPVPSASATRVVLGKPVTLSANTGYATYEWRKDDSEVVGTARTITVSKPGTYVVRVTKNGYSGFGISSPATITSQLEAQNQNFIVTNKLQFATRDATRIELVPIDSLSQTVQYFDGLGRLIQTTTTQSSPSREDVVLPASYDPFGREVRKYLPYVSGSDGRYKPNALSDPANSSSDPLIQYRSGNQYLFYQNAVSIAHDQYPYAETLLEAGPLNRPLQQGAPGQVWQPNPSSTFTSPASTGKASLNNYSFNGANEVLLWRYIPSETYPLGLVHAGTAAAPVYYPANTLYKNQVKDENRNQVITYTNSEGKVVLKRVQAAAGANPSVNDSYFASTYYIYDNFGQLVCVLPPEAVKNLATQYHHAAATEATKNAFLNLWAFRYRYDAQLRMVQKKMPGAKPTYTVYDTRGRIVLTQDGNQRSVASREWTFTKYDAFNRPVATGKYYNTDSLSVLQDKLDADAGPKFETYSGTGSYFGYSNQSFPTTPASDQYYTVSYYDRYDSNISPTGYNYLNESLPGQQPTSSTNVIGQMTGMLTRNLASGMMQRTVNYFDWKKRNIQSIVQHHRAGTIRASTIFDFVDKILVAQKTYLINGTTTKVKTSFNYDHTGRLLKESCSVNGSSEVVIAQHTYNLLGQLQDKQLHSVNNGQSFKQSVDYEYNIRGWLTKLNNPDISTIAGNDADYDYFGMELLYNTSISGVTSTKMYNGNISLMRWGKGYGATSAPGQAYTFSYDPLSRLSNATHYDHEVDFLTGTRSWKTNNNQFGEALTYDHNGNIKTLIRTGVGGSSLDNLTYSYKGNMLGYVNDSGDAAAGFVNGNAGGDDYSYDNNGNLDKDKNKGLSNRGDIKYNFLNLPEQITKGAEKVKYIYDATGLKLSQEVYSSSGVLSKVTDYVGEMILEGTTAATALKMILHSEGRILPDAAGWEYQYHLKDHLGNVRLTFTGKTQAEKIFTTNFEASSNSDFLNYSTHTFDLVDHTDAGTTYKNTQRLSGTNRVGLAKTFSVMPGDKIAVSAYVKYMNLGTTTNTASFINSLASAFGVSSTSTGEGAKIYTGLNGYTGLVVGGHPSDDDSGPPKAFVTILFFDKNYKLLDAAWDQVSSLGAQTSATVKQPHDLVTVTANAPDAGYAFVFLSNEHTTLVDVYFDDVSMSVLPSAIVSVDDYYPFGMVYNSHQRSDTYDQSFKFQGQEHVDELGLHWDSFKWRNHDPAIGRFFNIDPLADKYVYNSPYAFSENHVTVHVELEGLEKVYVFDQAENPKDKSKFTAQIYVEHENGKMNGPYAGSSFPNNPDKHNTVNEGTHLFNNESGHSKSQKQGLNIVNESGQRVAPGTDSNGNDVTMTVVNVHQAFKVDDRGSAGCPTIAPNDGPGFFSNFDWSGSKTVNIDGVSKTINGTTGTSTGSVVIYRGESSESKADLSRINFRIETQNRMNRQSMTEDELVDEIF